MKKLAVFITTHLVNDNTRHGRRVNDYIVEYYTNTVIHNYMNLDSGLSKKDLDIYIMDTGSTHPDFLRWLDKYSNDWENLHIRNIPNTGGFTASLKHCMHTDTKLQDKYEYFIFHIDDGVEPIADKWATDLISQFEEHNNAGLMGRYVDTIRLGPDGLIDHRKCCPHIAQMWNIVDIETIPHLHGDWWLINRNTLRDLAREWYNPIQSQEAMDYQSKWENKNYTEVEQINDHRQTLDNIHIGREVDMALRITRLLNKELTEYVGNKFLALQLHKR